MECRIFDQKDLDLIKLNDKELKLAESLWERNYEKKYIIKYGVIDTEIKDIIYNRKKRSAYQMNTQLNVMRKQNIRNKRISFK